VPTSLGPAEILVILVVALIVLGPKRLPEAGRQVGKALAEMRRWSRGIQNEIKDAFDTAEEPPRVTSEALAAEAAAAETAAAERLSERAEAGPEPGPEVASDPPPLSQAPRESSEPAVPNNGARPIDEPPRN
jgi:Tat protein translocase TatB subunit